MLKLPGENKDPGTTQQNEMEGVMEEGRKGRKGEGEREGQD